MVPDPPLWGFSLEQSVPDPEIWDQNGAGVWDPAMKEEPPRPYRALRGHSREQGGWEGAAGPIWGGRDPQGPKAELRGEKREKWAKRTENGECSIVGFRGLFVPSLILVFRTFLGFRIFDVVPVGGAQTPRTQRRFLAFSTFFSFFTFSAFSTFFKHSFDKYPQIRVEPRPHLGREFLGRGFRCPRVAVGGPPPPRTQHRFLAF